MTDNPDYIPFMTRFLAWWNGVEPGALARGGNDGDGSSLHSIVIDAEAEVDDGRRYKPERLDIVQRLWGEECHMPGGAARSLSLVKPMALNASKSACDLSAGLGGGTRLIHKELGVWIDAFEPDPELAEHAQDFSQRHGLARKVPVRTYEPGDLDLGGKHFDGILLREVMCGFPNIRDGLGKVDAALKSGGHVILTDFTYATDAKVNDPIAKMWLEKDPLAVAPFSLKQYKQAFDNLGWDVRIFEDDSDSYRHMVLAGFAQFIAGLHKSELTRQFVDAMLLEAETWLLRMKALESGAVKLLRAHAIKA